MVPVTTYRLDLPDRGPHAAAPALDEFQQSVVDHAGGPLLVLAGPGTGKTTTLVEAIVDRIESRGAAPSRCSRSPSAARPPSSCATGSPPGSAAPWRPR